jgi:hypothetical protein
VRTAEAQARGLEGIVASGRRRPPSVPQIERMRQRIELGAELSETAALLSLGASRRSRSSAA